jgi:hypothetical protein
MVVRVRTLLLNTIVLAGISFVEEYVCQYGK